MDEDNIIHIHLTPKERLLRAILEDPIAPIFDDPPPLNPHGLNKPTLMYNWTPPQTPQNKSWLPGWDYYQLLENQEGYVLVCHTRTHGRAKHLVRWIQMKTLKKYLRSIDKI